MNDENKVKEGNIKIHIPCPECKNMMWFTREKGDFNLYICNKCHRVYEINK